MCKRSSVGTYLRVNALQDNAHTFVFRSLLLLSAIFSNEKWSFFYIGRNNNLIRYKNET